MEHIRGVDILLEVEIDGTYQCVAGQTGATLNRSRDSIETTHKPCRGAGVENAGAAWRSRVPGLGEWSIDADGLVSLSDETYALLESAFMNAEPIQARISTPAGVNYTGVCILTDLPLEAGLEDIATWSATLEGSGPLEQTTGVTPSTLPSKVAKGAK